MIMTLNHTPKHYFFHCFLLLRPGDYDNRIANSRDHCIYYRGKGRSRY
uniref:Uncharacterized protein n=1 Tax=Rhizophora mucronata TaxID=61149 RepID=A0A2P2NGJ1_RHIMU